jgi:hypothetical protein
MYLSQGRFWADVVSEWERCCRSAAHFRAETKRKAHGCTTDVVWESVKRRDGETVFWKK